jgi:hypothetical protein
LLLVLGCGQPATRPTTPPEPPPPEPPPAAWFEDVTAPSGVKHTYHNGQEAGHLAILESLGGGVALLDYDGDGWLDLWFPGGGDYEGPEHRDIVGRPNRLYRNRGDGTFEDVSAAVGLDHARFYSHGAAVGDFDRDGWPDVLVTGYGGLSLYHNQPAEGGGRRFVEISQAAGLTDRLWSTSAAWADFDGDGFPDLYVCHYVDWSFSKHPRCSYHDVAIADVCPPGSFQALPHTLYRNRGNGTFEDVSHLWGLDRPAVIAKGKGLGVVAADFNGDHRPDVYVANDTTDNLLFLNRGRQFEEVGLTAGVARDDRGVANGSMGVTVGDPDRSGRPSLFITNYQHELPALYRNDGGGLFTFHSQSSGVAAVGQQYVGFGTAFADFDRDGWADLAISNGHVIRHPVGTTVLQRPLLLRNRGQGRFAVITNEGGSYFQGQHAGRGLVAGDLDNDGRIDLVISHVNQPAAVLRNTTPVDAHWLGIELQGDNLRDVVGARVVLTGEPAQTQFAISGGSYLSSGDRRLLFGLGSDTSPRGVTVHWPTGEPREETWPTLALDRYHRLVQGSAPKP